MPNIQSFPLYSDSTATTNTSFIFEDHNKNLLNQHNEPDPPQTTLDPPRINEPHGDDPSIKDEANDRWYLQNINGTSTELDWIEWKDQMKTLQDLKVDGFSFTETNLIWTPEQIRKARKLGGDRFKQFRLITSASNDPTSRPSYQPGGTCTGVTNKLSGRIIEEGNDPSGLGRWSYYCLEGKSTGNNKKGVPIPRRIYVVTAYCVAQTDSAKPGHDTAFMQQKRLLTLKGIENPKPRKQWTDDLTLQLESWIREDAEIILCMDANADLLEPALQKMLSTTGLIDLVAHQLGSCLPETYVRGKRTIDHIFGTPHIATAVRGAGFLAYNDGIVSDHRGIFLDLCRKTLFGARQNIEEREARRLTTSNKRGAAQYRQSASNSIIMNNLLKRAQDIETAAKIEFTEEVEEALESLDQELHQILLDAEDNIDQNSQIPWSPQLHKAYQIWKYWKIRLSYHKTNRNPGSRVIAFMGLLSTQYEVNQGDKDRSISGQLRKARLALQQCRQTSADKRKAYMDKLILEYELGDKPDQAKIVRRIVRAEAQVKMYRLIRRYLKQQTQSVTYVEVPQNPNDDPKTATNWRKIFNKDELEKILHERNSKHFSQAATDRTPFTIDPLYSLLEFTADTEFSEQFRKGEIDLNTLDLDDDVLALLEEFLPKQDDPSKISEDLPIDEVISGFRKWNEQTTTGGRHLGHYKSWMMKRKDGEDSLTETEFFNLLITIYRICLTNQYPLKRWQTCLNLFIPKDPGSCKLHRLRVIHIVDTCLNFLRRFFIARRLLSHLHDHHGLAVEQWGGIPGRTAIDLVMSKEIMITTLHLMRKNGALTDVDATACYDRIIPCLMWLAYNKAGATWNIVQLFAKALVQLKYYIITAFGKSERSNSHSKKHQFLGPGQGAADSPFAWALISTKLIAAYKRRAKGCKISDPTGTLTWKRAIDMFVDDSYLYHALAFLIGAMALMKLINHDVSLWSKLLWTSGGAINFGKSFYSMLIWKFKPTGQAYPMKNADLPPNTVYVENPSDPTEELEIERKCVTKATKTLGVMKAADLSQNGELQHLKEKAHTFAKALVACPLSHVHAWLAYITIFITGVTYSFPTTSLSEKECVTLQKIVKPILLRKLGLPPTLPNDVVYGDQYFGGVGLIQLFAEQGMLMTLLFLRHIRAKTDLGKQIEIGLRYYQLHAGLSNCVLEDTRPLAHLKFPWFDTLRQYLHQISGRLQLTDPWRPKRQRVHDTFIMENVLDTKRFTTTELEIINACRLYLQVSRVSDIATINGKRVLTKMLSGEYTQEDILEFRTTYTWPHQERPNSVAWKLWTEALTSTICDESGKLHRTLGPWNATMESTWKYWISPTNDALFAKTPQGWKSHDITRHGLIKRFTTNSKNSEPPLDLYPAIPKITNSKLICTNHQSSRSPIEETKITSNNFNEYLENNTEKWETHLLDNTREIHGKEPDLKTNLQMGKDLFLVSDGGDTDGSGYFGWVIANDTTILCQGNGLSPGNTELNESLRSESTAYLSMLRYLLHYQRFHNITLESSSKIHYCDNKSLVFRSPDTYRSAPPNSHDFLKPDYDVQMQIMQTIRELDTVMPTLHVKGHQDKDIPESELSYEARLNIQADILATRAWKHHKCGHKHVHYPASECSLFINNKVITRAYRVQMRRAYSSHNTREYLMDKFHWSSDTITTIDWYSHGTSIAALPHNQLRFVQRFIIDWLPYNNRLHERGQSPSNLCTTCNEEPETERHFLFCTSNQQDRTKLHDALRKVFNKHNVDPNIRKVIYQALDISIAAEPTYTREWCELTDIPLEYETLVDAQEKVGIDQIWYGRIPLEYDRYQRRYEKLMSKTNEDPTGEPKWIRALILTIWQHCHTRWTNRCDTQFSDAQKCTYKREQLLHQINTLYSKEEQLLVQDQYIFQTPLEEWETKSTAQIAEWILKYKPVIKQCLALAQKQLKKHATDIRRFYPTTTAQLPVKKQRPSNRAPTRRKYQQTNLHNQPIRSPIQTKLASRKARKKQKTQRQPVQVQTQKLSEFFPPKDTRSEHRKLAARARPTLPVTNNRGESNQFQDRSGD